MHSYVKNNKASYTVGLWLATGDQRGMTFSHMFDVGNRDEAMLAVNMLNGGSPNAIGAGVGRVIYILKEH